MNIKQLLAASIGLNVFLLGVEAYLVKQNLGDLTTLPPLVVCIPAAELDPIGEPGTGAASGLKPSPTYTVGRIESPEFRNYVAHLRSLGCPDETIRELIVTDVSDLFRNRIKGKAYTASRFGP
jgi:hypothetical protein